MSTVDDKVDTRLGDTISFSVDGAAYSDLRGFVLTANTSLDQDMIDEGADGRNRIKVAKDMVPTITTGMRFRHPRLGEATFKWARNSQVQNEGRYWVLEIQKA